MKEYYLLANGEIAEVINNNDNDWYYPDENEEVGYQVTIYDRDHDVVDYDPNYIADTAIAAASVRSDVVAMLGHDLGW